MFERGDVLILFSWFHANVEKVFICGLFLCHVCERKAEVPDKHIPQVFLLW